MAAERDANNPRDPRFTRFRVAAYGLYIVVAAAFSLFVIWNVVRSVSAMTPPHLPNRVAALSSAECLTRAEALWSELEAKRRGLGEHRPASAADDDWPAFRVAWLQRQREAEAACSSDSRPTLREVFLRLDQAMDLYTTNTVQYAGETGPTVDKLRAALERARSEAR